jgi:insertion element IS1 protein InsB
MKCGISLKKKKKLWVIKALDRRTGRIIAWELGGRNVATFRRLYKKLRHLSKCRFYTDNWSAFAKVLPRRRHIIGKQHTGAIERDNSNTRHHLGRFTRRTKVVSKTKEMVEITLRLWQALTNPAVFATFQITMLSIFK